MSKLFESARTGVSKALLSNPGDCGNWRSYYRDSNGV